MRSFRQFSKILYLAFFLSMPLCIFVEWMSLSAITILALSAFLSEFLYYIVENMSDVVLIPIGNIVQNRRKSAFILVIALLLIIVCFNESGVTIKNIFQGVIFGFMGLRGFLFPKQTVVSVRIFREGFEYGYWNTYVGWDKVLSYTKIDGGNRVLLEKSGLFNKKFSIEFNKASDVIEFEKYLKPKSKSVVPSGVKLPSLMD